MVGRRAFLAAASFLLAGITVSQADAGVVARVSKSRQMMYVYVDGQLEHVWRVSTARDGYSTPSGVYRPSSFDRFHRSSRYGNAPMPYSIFFRGGYAIHGSYDVYHLGRPASHGCIRLDPESAGELFYLMQNADDARIVIAQ